MIDLIDGLRELLEPSEIGEPGKAQSGAKIDATCAQPFEFVADTFYAWEESDARTLDETYHETSTGATFGVERQNFEIVLVYVADGRGENSETRRLREVSIALDERRQRYLRAVREHRSNGDLWQHILGSADADFVRDLGTRGIAIRITGWRFVS